MQDRLGSAPRPAPQPPLDSRRYSQRVPALGQAAVQRDAVAQVDVDLVPSDALLLAALLRWAQLQPYGPAQLAQRPRLRIGLRVHRLPQLLGVGGRRGWRRGPAGGAAGRRAVPPGEEAEGGQQPQSQQRAPAAGAPSPLAPAHPAADEAGHTERVAGLRAGPAGHSAGRGRRHAFASGELGQVFANLHKPRNSASANSPPRQETRPAPPPAAPPSSPPRPAAPRGRETWRPGAAGAGGAAPGARPRLGLRLVGQVKSKCIIPITGSPFRDLTQVLHGGKGSEGVS